MGNNMKINWKKLFVIIVLLLFIGTIIAVVLVNIDKINVLNEAINENIEILEKTITEIEKFRKGLLKEMQKRGYKKLF